MAREQSGASRSQPSPDHTQLDTLARRYPSVARLLRAARDLNSAMVVYHREHPLPDEFIQEHRALTDLFTLPKEES